MSIYPPPPPPLPRLTDGLAALWGMDAVNTFTYTVGMSRRLVMCRESLQKASDGAKMKKYFLSLSFLFPVAPPFVRDPPSLLPLSLSVPLLLPFVLPLSSVVCRHAGISGPQNDRPNLSALAPVTKDGRRGSARACDWCTSEFPAARLVGTCLSAALLFFFEKVCVCVQDKSN